MGYPDVKGREDPGRALRRKPLAEDVDLHTLAKSTGGFTGADLENLMNEGPPGRRDSAFHQHGRPAGSPLSRSSQARPRRAG